MCSPINPIRNVQRPISTEGSKVMSCYRLRFTRPLEHEELREDSDGFKPDGEWPENLRDGKLVVENEREDEAGTKEVFDFKGVDRRVMGWPVGIGIRGLIG